MPKALCNSAWELKWSLMHHNEWSPEGSEKNNVGKKNKNKRGRDDDDGTRDPNDKTWQAKHDALNAKFQ